ncbi:MAG: type I secretion system permease/ATPase [Rhodobacter sp.]|nr:type I secretion system permease/ATPase [Rhodobacter sp.]
MWRSGPSPGAAELRLAFKSQRGLFIATIVFSSAVNLLMLTSPLYMLQVYDRVLGSQSEATLVALTLLMTALFVIMAVFDHLRSRILARIGAGLQDALDPRVFNAALTRQSTAPDDTAALAAQRDVEAIRTFWSSQSVTALIDMPWAPLYFAAIFIFHPILGWLAIAGAAVILGMALLNQRNTHHALQRANETALLADRQADRMRAEAETLRALGMTGAAFARWQKTRSTALQENIAAGDSGGSWSAASRGFRLYLQSAMLGLAAWVVLQGELTAGAMIAASILMGRALQPIEQTVAQWPILTRTLGARARLAELLSRVPQTAPRTALPRPAAKIEVANLTLIPPGQSAPTLRGLSFSLQPGQALGVIGPSGAGKSTLARALTGLWPPASGSIRLDGASLDQFDPDRLGALIGYLPQRVSLFDGTIAENIARLAPTDDARIVAAAQAAAAHDMILRLPRGYDTRLDSTGGLLSGGQIQRIGLARALYGQPVLLILDEPNSNLDNEGSLAVNAAIRAHKAAGGAALIMAHRPAAIQECDLLLVLEDGLRRAFGPRDQVLRDMVQNAGDIVGKVAPGGIR